MIKSKRYPGVYLYQHKSKKDTTYYITYKSENKLIWKKIGKKSEGITEKKAFDFKNSLLHKKRLGSDISKKNHRFLTLDDIADEYFITSSLRSKSSKKYKQLYQKHIKPTIGNKTIQNLKAKDIYHLQENLSKELSKSSINLITKLVKRLINYAIKEELIAYNPLKNLKQLKVDNHRLRYLSTKEIQKLYELIKDDIDSTLFVKLSLITGARANSILSIKLKDINFEQKTINLKDFKRDDTYIGYLDDEAIKLIQKQLKDDNPNQPIIKQNYQNIYKKLYKAFSEFNKGLDKSDRKNRVVIHTLRHTFASHLAINGVSIQKIQKLLNHKDIKQTLIYAKLSPDTLREDVKELYNKKEKYRNRLEKNPKDHTNKAISNHQDTEITKQKENQSRKVTIGNISKGENSED